MCPTMSPSLLPINFFRFHQPQNIIKHTLQIHTIKLALMAPHQKFKFHQEKCRAEPSLQSKSVAKTLLCCSKRLNTVCQLIVSFRQVPVNRYQKNGSHSQIASLLLPQTMHLSEKGHPMFPPALLQSPLQTSTFSFLITCSIPCILYLLRLQEL
jgi:hypothetical protein